MLQEGRDTVRNMTVLFLALRRMMLYAQAKLNMVFWTGWLQFHKMNPKGSEMLYGLDLIDGCIVPSYPHGWQREAWESMTCLFDGMVNEPLAGILSTNIFAPAEVIFQHPGVKKVFDFAGILGKKQEQEAAVEVGLKQPPVVPEPEGAQEPAQPPAPEAEKEVQITSAEDGKVDESLNVEMLPEDPQVKDNEPVFWQAKFPDLVLPDSVIETFSNGDDAVFEKLYGFASSRSLPEHVVFAAC